MYIYRPQRSWAKVMFLQVCVILFTEGGCVEADPPRKRPPEKSEPPEKISPPRKNQTPPKQIRSPRNIQTPPLKKSDTTPPEKIRPPSPPGILSMSGRYAPYWNAFLSCDNFRSTTICAKLVV